jgi:hypothetical protein
LQTCKALPLKDLSTLSFTWSLTETEWTLAGSAEQSNHCPQHHSREDIWRRAPVRSSRLVSSHFKAHRLPGASHVGARTTPNFFLVSCGRWSAHARTSYDWRGVLFMCSKKSLTTQAFLSGALTCGRSCDVACPWVELFRTVVDHVVWDPRGGRRLRFTAIRTIRTQ